MTDPQRIVVLGGGFTGVTTAQELTRLLRRQGRRAMSEAVAADAGPGLIAWFLWRTSYLLRLPSRDRRLRVALDWALELFLAHDVVEINMRRSRTRPGEEVGEVIGEPASVGVRSEAPEELVV